MSPDGKSLPAGQTAHERLLAAAPDLLAACEEAAARFPGMVSEEEWYASSEPADLLRRLTQAIHKATGQQP